MLAISYLTKAFISSANFYHEIAINSKIALFIACIFRNMPC